MAVGGWCATSGCPRLGRAAATNRLGYPAEKYLADGDSNRNIEAEVMNEINNLQVFFVKISANRNAQPVPVGPTPPHQQIRT
jgi:hypothetical protein